jgi:hypothetical protein
VRGYFGGNVEHHRNPYFAALVPETERKFDANTAEFAADREAQRPFIRRVAATRHRVTPFDIAYIDGSHRAAD